MAQNKPIFFESIICLKAYDFVACLLIIEIWRDVTDGEERTVKITVIYQKSSSLQLPTSNTCCHSKKCNSNKAKIVQVPSEFSSDKSVQNDMTLNCKALRCCYFIGSKKVLFKFFQSHRIHLSVRELLALFSKFALSIPTKIFNVYYLAIFTDILSQNLGTNQGAQKRSLKRRC